MFFKKKKTAEDYYMNELMRSRMSPISIRTDEIIQQYFFASKEQTLNLEEYLKIRELATKELMSEFKPPITQELTANKNPEAVTVRHEIEQAIGEPTNDNSKINFAAPAAHREAEKAFSTESVNFHHEEKIPSQSATGAANGEPELSYSDFLAMMQGVDD